MKIALALIILASSALAAAPCRFVATWGGPLVQWHEPATGHRWTCSYAEFFAHCGKKHPREMGIKVLGSLPPASQRQPAPALALAAPTRPARVNTRGKAPAPQIEAESLPRMTGAETASLLLPPALPSRVTLAEACRSMATGLPPENDSRPEIEPERETSPSDYRIVSLLSENEAPVDLVELVKGFEGFRPKAYWDYGQKSIGYGTKARQGEETITEEEAARRLRAELATAAKAVEAAAAAHGLRLTAAQKVALTSFHFNTGAIARVLELSAGDIAAIPAIMQQWRKAGGKVQRGLVARRQTEANLYASN